MRQGVACLVRVRWGHRLTGCALWEVHTEAELARVLELPGVEKHILGINNRDLGTFKVREGRAGQGSGLVAGNDDLCAMRRARVPCVCAPTCACVRVRVGRWT